MNWKVIFVCDSASYRIESTLSNEPASAADDRSSASQISAKKAPQTILFLQGHPSWFARRLARAFENEGCRVLRVNFCMGDAVYWLGRSANNFRGSVSEWPKYLRELIAREHVTDILFYGDGRPYHRLASDVAADVGINAYVYEFGYLRPDWLTLERGGMSGRSHFPNDPSTIRSIGALFPSPDLKARTHFSMSQEMAHEIAYNLVSYFLHVAYPRYVADRYYNPVFEYLAGVPKQMRASRLQREASGRIAKLVGERRPFYLVPLQLQCDYQLRHNSGYSHQGDAIREVMASFARNAPTDAALVFKCHPLDNGAEHWPRVIRAAAETAGIAEDRLHYLEGGDLGTLLGHARGTVTINSTVGLRALIAGCPVKILGTALFDIDGLTHQASLDTFWLAPTQPDSSLVEALIKALAGTIQVKGDFFSEVGQKAAIATFVERIVRGTVNGSGAFVATPPRLSPVPRRQ